MKWDNSPINKKIGNATQVAHSGVLKMTTTTVCPNSVRDLRDISDPAWLEAVSQSREVVFPANAEVYGDGDSCTGFLLVRQGAIRVNKVLENGRELVLYHIQSGGCCSLTISVLLAGKRYSAHAVAEGETRVMFIPKRSFDRAFARSVRFRDFVCAELGGRFHDTLMKIESLALRNVEVRLARWLIQHSSDNGTIEASHRELACELGTAREVISRHLKNFEKKGLVKLSRKYIKLSDTSALDAFFCSNHA